MRAMAASQDSSRSFSRSARTLAARSVMVAICFASSDASSTIASIFSLMRALVAGALGGLRERLVVGHHLLDAERVELAFDERHQLVGCERVQLDAFRQQEFDLRFGGPVLAEVRGDRVIARVVDHILGFEAFDVPYAQAEVMNFERTGEGVPPCVAL